MKWIFKVRGLAMVPPAVFAMLCSWGEVEEEIAVFGLGGLTFALGLALRLWAQVHLRYRLQKKTVLTTTGPYAYVRNPIYIANTLLLVGMCMVAELFWLVPLQLLYCAVIYHAVVRYEESHLAEKHGQPYLDYVSRVPRWVPRLRVGRGCQGSAHGLLLPSVLAEAHNLLLLLPAIVKELLGN